MFLYTSIKTYRQIVGFLLIKSSKYINWKNRIIIMEI